jgi:glycosyltransferase involved in cell wall biosynthesis
MPDGWQGDADCYYMKWVPYVPMVAISESARAQEKFPLNFVGMVHHGLPMKLFRPLGNRRGDFFVWLGRFVPKKGAHIAVEAAKQAEVPIVLAGTMDLYDQGSIQYFYRVIEPLIDGKQVKYIGPVNMKQKIELLSYARGLLNPINLEEPFGLVMIEAMALGCPVIAFARGAAPELIIHGKTGFLAQNIDEIVYFISRIDEIDRDLTRRHVQNNFSACAMAKKYVKIYEKVIQIDKESPVPMERVKVHDQ